jgi:hypothetical protein
MPSAAGPDPPHRARTPPGPGAGRGWATLRPGVCAVGFGRNRPQPISDRSAAGAGGNLTMEKPSQGSAASSSADLGPDPTRARVGQPRPSGFDRVVVKQGSNSGQPMRARCAGSGPAAEGPRTGPAGEAGSLTNRVHPPSLARSPPCLGSFTQQLYLLRLVYSLPVFATACRLIDRIRLVVSAGEAAENVFTAFNEYIHCIQ